MNARCRLVGLLFVPVVVWAGCSSERPEGRVVTAKAGLVSGAGEAVLEIQSSWTNGYCAKVTVTNKGTTDITAWSVVVDAQQSTLSGNPWSATSTNEGTEYTFVPMDYNDVIAPGKTEDFGFCAKKTVATAEPVLKSLEVTGGGEDADAGTGDPGAVLKVTNDWKTGYCATVSVPNDRTSNVTDWSVVIDVGNVTVNNVWDAKSTVAGTELTADALTHNGLIAPGSSANFGFCAKKNSVGKAAPVVVSVDLEPVLSGTGGAGTGGDATGGLGEQGGEAGSPEQGGQAGSPEQGGEAGSPEQGGQAGSLGQGGSSGEVGATGGTGGSVTVPATIAIDGSPWATGYCATVTVSNERTTKTTDWTVVVDLGAATLKNLWSGSYTANGSQLSVDAMSWNAEIAPGKSTSFGFCASKADGAAVNPTVVSAELEPPIVGTGGTTGTGGTAGTGGDGTGGTDEPPVEGATLVFSSEWGAGYCADVTVVNETGAAVTGWSVEIDMGESKLSNNNLWNGDFAVSGSVLTVEDVSFNSTLPVTGEPTFGFCATKTGTDFTPVVTAVEFTTASGGN